MEQMQAAGHLSFESITLAIAVIGSFLVLGTTIATCVWVVAVIRANVNGLVSSMNKLAISLEHLSRQVQEHDVAIAKLGERVKVADERNRERS